MNTGTLYNVNGVEYAVFYKTELSTREYTKRLVYHIYTQEQSFPIAHKAIETIMNDNSWRKGDYVFCNQREPSLKNHLHPYHKFDFDDDLKCYVYILVIPYDD